MPVTCVAKFPNVPFPPILCNVTEASLTGLPDESVTVAVIVVGWKIVNDGESVERVIDKGFDKIFTLRLMVCSSVPTFPLRFNNTPSPFTSALQFAITLTVIVSTPPYGTFISPM